MPDQPYFPRACYTNLFFFFFFFLGGGGYHPFPVSAMSTHPFLEAEYWSRKQRDQAFEHQGGVLDDEVCDAHAPQHRPKSHLLNVWSHENQTEFKGQVQ